jgi:hypothetical protein
LKFERTSLSSLILCLVAAPAAALPQATQTQKLLGSTIGAGAHFGRSISLFDGDLLVGSAWNTGGFKHAYAFVRAAGSWNEQAILNVPNNGNELRVAIRGDLALIGAPQYDGFAWRFGRSGTTWSGPVPINMYIGHDEWGFSVAIGDEQRILIGAPHADSCFPNEAGILVGYCPSGTSWLPSFTLGDPNACSVTYHEGFGCSVASSGATVAVGANGVDPAWGYQTGPGQAFLFHCTCSGHGALATLTGPTPRFGESVALDGDELIVGSYGAAYAFTRVGSSWIAQGTLDAQDPLAGGEYGSAVALRGDIALVGDPTNAIAGTNAGAVYVFRRSAASWSRIGVLVGNDSVAGDRFGAALALSDARIAVGAPLADTQGADAGAVYVFELPQAPPHTYCEGKQNSQGCVPQIGFDGIPSASTPSVFDVSAIQELNQKTGLLLYGTAGIASNPFQGGTLCIAPPLHRTGGQSSFGSAPPVNDCSGSYHYDFNARIQSGFDPGLVPGVRVAAQYWSRDPQDAYGTALSNALLFTVGP